MRTGEILTLLHVRGHEFQKSLGQNFLADESILDKIIESSRVEASSNVLEIGAGAGILTYPLAQKANKVLTIELDRALEGLLGTVLAGQNNVKTIFGDATKIDIKAETDAYFGGGSFKVVSNLPYSITSQIIERLLTIECDIEDITLMVQLEAAHRILAMGSSKQHSPLSLLVAQRSKAELLFTVGRKCFDPQPNVDSAVIRLDLQGAGNQYDEKLFNFIKSCFTMKRKTLANNIAGFAGLNKTEVEQLLASAGLSADIRAERVDANEFQNLYNTFMKDRS